MVRNKPRKTYTHGKTDPKKMEDAVKLVLHGRTIRKVSKEKRISKLTLQRYVATAKANVEITGTGRRVHSTTFVFDPVYPQHM